MGFAALGECLPEVEEPHRYERGLGHRACVGKGSFALYEGLIGALVVHDQDACVRGSECDGSDDVVRGFGSLERLGCQRQYISRRIDLSHLVEHCVRPDHRGEARTGSLGVDRRVDELARADAVAPSRHRPGRFTHDDRTPRVFVGAVCAEGVFGDRCRRPDGSFDGLGDERARDAYREIGLTCRDGPRDRRSDVVEVGFDALCPIDLGARPQSRSCVASERGEVPGVPLAGGVRSAGGHEAFLGVLSDRFQLPVPRPDVRMFGVDQRLVDQTRKRVDHFDVIDIVAGAQRLRGIERASAREHA